MLCQKHAPNKSKWLLADDGVDKPYVEYIYGRRCNSQYFKPPAGSGQPVKGGEECVHSKNGSHEPPCGIIAIHAKIHLDAKQIGDKLKGNIIAERRS